MSAIQTLGNILEDGERRDALIIKVLRIAARICWMHGSVAGDRICQDWSDDYGVLDALTQQEKNALRWMYEQVNSGGSEYEDDSPWYDEMVISFVVASFLDRLVGRKENA